MATAAAEQVIVVRPTAECLRDAGVERAEFQRYYRMIYNKRTSSIAVYGPFPVDKDYKMAAFAAILPAGEPLANEGCRCPGSGSRPLLDLFREFINQVKKVKKSKRKRSHPPSEVNEVTDGLEEEEGSPEELNCAIVQPDDNKNVDDPPIASDCVTVCVGSDLNLTLSKIELTITECSANEAKLAEGRIVEIIEISSDEEEDMEIYRDDWDISSVQFKQEPL